MRDNRLTTFGSAAGIDNAGCLHGERVNGGFTRLTIVDSTITGSHGHPHQLPNVGGIQDVHGGFGPTFPANKILSGNGPAFFPADCVKVQSLGGGNLIGDSANCHALTRPDDLLGVDPGLGPPADNGGFTRTRTPGPNVVEIGAGAIFADTFEVAP